MALGDELSSEIALAILAFKAYSGRMGWLEKKAKDLLSTFSTMFTCPGPQNQIMFSGNEVFASPLNIIIWLELKD